MSSKHDPKSGNESDSILPRSNARSAALSVSNRAAAEPPADHFILHNQDVVTPYLTPYQPITKSNSKERVPDTEPQSWARPASCIIHMAQRRTSSHGDISPSNHLRRYAKGNPETHKRHKHQKIAKAFPYNVYKGSFNRQDVLIKHTRLRYPPILPK
ncbi:hypothetical protein COCVIDRAFT_21289 [Bipolaris victoriae FI3]|uniref:Uncharacterized protein n=1 Tax=Bipolaris victoriae (strain FI3) TaxID=930091 RepID=W7E3S2_BIPV3|nr:hypothetical protein COCVIDRAFT_21289 [Bipolaris victoriae FI3]